jgi:hypothetical protein
MLANGACLPAFQPIHLKMVRLMKPSLLGGTMRSWISWIMLIVLLAIPATASAQSPIVLGSVSIQLLPEFDQPSMLVIYDFILNESTTLPADLQVRIPLDGNLIAVAYNQDGNLFNAPYEAPYIEGDWQVIKLAVDSYTTYHIEYYAPLTRVELQRTYEFLWPGDYATERFDLHLKVPVDTTEIVTDPQMTETKGTGDDDTYMQWGTDNLQEGEQVPVKITYVKTTERLSTSGATLQAGTVDDNTPGRVSLNNYLPYILGGLGVFLILAGLYYFWPSGLRQIRPRKRRRSTNPPDKGEQIYCHQCGQRAQSGDRFCRTCGTRLRLDH